MGKKDTKPDDVLTLADVINSKTEQALDGEPNNDLVSLIAINELTNLNKLKVVSRVKIEQVPILSKLYLYSETFKSDFTSRLANNILELQISVGGLGRKELVQVVNQSQPIIEQKRGLFAKKEVYR